MTLDISCLNHVVLDSDVPQSRYVISLEAKKLLPADTRRRYATMLELVFFLPSRFGQRVMARGSLNLSHQLFIGNAFCFVVIFTLALVL